MSADERFIAGEDRLAALLREVPAFVPPASLEAAVLAAARAEQAARQMARQAAAPPLPPAALPARVRAYSEQADYPTGDDELAFAPPAGLEASVMAEAARLQVAQAARRSAVLEEVRRGDAPQSVLGAPVSAAAQAWLREQASGEQAAAKPERARRARRWWPALGVLAGTLGVGVLSMQIVLRQLDLRDGEITLPAKAPATERAKRATAAPAMHADAGRPAAEPPQAESAGQPASPLADAKTPPAPAQPPPAAAPGPSAAQAPAASPAATANAQPSHALTAKAQASAAPREPDMLAEHRLAAARESEPAAGGSLSAGAPPAAAPVIRAPAPMASMAPMPPMASVAPPAPVAPIPPPAPAPAIEPPRFALRASPAQQAETARAPAPAARGQRLGAWTMSLREEPQLAVERLMSDAPGTGSAAAGAPLALRITAAAPASPEVRAWVDRLWQAVPAERRPPLPYAVQADSTLPPATVRIERQADNAP
ncbi:hypothetical protein UB46_15255 [Burkholderiaceae bacterium 16]|nr:hypothetical protein UB46_15255 [Burkholderiaceae bacterium 16]